MLQKGREMMGGEELVSFCCAGDEVRFRLSSSRSPSPDKISF